MAHPLGILITGQSLAEGGMGKNSVAGVEAARYPDRAFMLTGGPVGVQRSQLRLPLVPLRDAKKRTTVASSLAHRLLKAGACAMNPLVISGQAWGGKSYADLQKGSPSGFQVYEQCLVQVALIASVLPDIRYRAVLVIHGEQDGLKNNSGYEADLVGWLEAFDADIRRITGQEEPVQLYLCQTATAGGYGFNGGIAETAFPTPLAQLSAHGNQPGITLIGPKYALPYADYAHLTNLGQCLLGEYYAKALHAHRHGQGWEPLRPAGFQVRERSVVIDFLVPVGEIEFDTTTVAAATNYGFDYRDDAGNGIRSVEKTGPRQVSIQLTGVPAANAYIAYAYCNGEGGDAQVQGRGDRGNLRDQDESASAYDAAYRLYNWCCIFRQRLT